MRRVPVPFSSCWLSVLALVAAACTSPDRSDPMTTISSTLAVRDRHSFAVADEARVTHLVLDWTVDFDERRLEGSARLMLERSPDARELVLDTRELDIESVQGADGSPLAFELGEVDEHLGAPLTIELNAGTREIAIAYRTSPKASGLQWLGAGLTAGKRHPYMFSQAQAIHARSFVPCQDSPGIRVTYEATVRTPPELRAVMSAEDVTGEGAEPGVYSFRMEQPIPAYLIAIAVGDLVFEEIGPRTGVWAEPGVAEKGAWEFADLESMLTAVEALYGTYRWGRYDVLVLPPSFPFGGMENPRMTFATPTLLAGDRSLVSVIAHELAHSWSGNLVTNATWSDFWLNEGFTVYLERRILEEIYGEEQARRDSILGRNDLLGTIEEFADKPGDTRLYIDLSGRDPDDGMTDVAYEKGALLLLHLERSVGRRRFDAFLRSWFDEMAWRPVTTPMFEEFLVERLLAGDRARAEALEIEQWLYAEGMPSSQPEFDEDVFTAPRTAAAQFAAGERTAVELNAGEWTTHEWLHFLERLPKDVSADQLGELDEAYALTARGNAEIAAAWLEACIRGAYDPAWPRLESFLVEIGRRKFLKPLYTELAKTPNGLQHARAIYAKARSGYHPIARSTIDEILGIDA